MIKIRDKIQNLLNNGVNEECHVICLLVYIRKILEHENDYKANNTREEVLGYSSKERLKIYCDWAFHPKVESPGFQYEITTYLDKALKENPISRSAENIFKFHDLRGCVENFLGCHGLKVLDLDWSRFIFLYASIINDCPLVFEKPSNNRREKRKSDFKEALLLNYEKSPLDDVIIKEIVVKVELGNEEYGYQQYAIYWFITDNQNQSTTFPIYGSFQISLPE